MVVTLASRPEIGWLYIAGKGMIKTLTEEELFASECYEEIRKHGAQKVLIDQRGIEFKSKIADQYEVVSYYDEFPPEIRRIKIALVVNPEEKELHVSWELFAHNKGYRWKVFTEMEAAEEFLQQDQK